MSRSRIIQSGILLFLLVGLAFTSSQTFSFWRKVNITKTVEVISLGEPVELIITDLNTTNKTYALVPTGYVIAVGDIDEVTLQYTIGVSKELLSHVNLVVEANQVTINDDDTYSNLVDINILGMGDNVTLDLYNDVLTVTITVKLHEPIDAAEAAEKGLDPSAANVDDSKVAYEAIHGQLIKFALDFHLEVKDSSQ